MANAYVFIYLTDEDIKRENVIVNGLFQALAAPVATVDIVHAGPDHKLAVRITYRVVDPMDQAIEDYYRGERDFPWEDETTSGSEGYDRENYD